MPLNSGSRARQIFGFGAGLVYIASSQSVGTTQGALSQYKLHQANKQTPNTTTTKSLFGGCTQLTDRALAIVVGTFGLNPSTQE